jgi:hypothetical protein
MTQPKVISRRIVRFAIALLTTASLVGLLALMPAPELTAQQQQQRSAQWGGQPAIAQQIPGGLPGAVEPWQQVYELIPELPLENHYVNARTGEPSPNNTLVGRLIRYHLYTKSRPPNYRLDWKLTMADYLGANDWIRAELYPGGDTLTVNPMEGDLAVIRSLTRAQRDALVNAMVTIFSGETGTTATPELPTDSETTAPTPPPTPPSSGNSPTILQPRPGDAQLLLP